MTKIKRPKIYWFFRSFFIASVIIYCVLLLVFGMGYCYEKMEFARTGRTPDLIGSLVYDIFNTGR